MPGSTRQISPYDTSVYHRHTTQLPDVAVLMFVTSPQSYCCNIPEFYLKSTLVPGNRVRGGVVRLELLLPTSCTLVTERSCLSESRDVFRDTSAVSDGGFVTSQLKIVLYTATTPEECS